MPEVKKCSFCGITEKETRIILFKYKVLLCNRHRQQLEQQGRFIRGMGDENKIIVGKNFSKLEVINRKFEKTIGLIDNDDVERVRKVKWFKQCNYIRGYKNGKKFFLHHFIIGRKKGLIVDHINCNSLDNRKENLRHVTYTENNLNNKVRKGVSWDKRAKKWQAVLHFEGKKHWLGRFKKEEDAWEARKKIEKKLCIICQNR